MKKILLDMKDIFFDALYPDSIKCIICDDELNEAKPHDICDACLNKLPVIKKPCKACGQQISGKGEFCLECKERKWNFTKAIACFNYENDVVNLVHKLKYGNAQYLAKSLAEFMIDEYNKSGIKADIIIFVPQSTQRTKQRGYNQAQLLAQEISKQIRLPVENDVIKRIKNTESQTHLTYSERAENLKGAFAVIEKAKLKGKNILLVDDIFTTGATAEEISRILKKAGSNEVYVLTLAHTKKILQNQQI